jgi:hypothetical protein
MKTVKNVLASVAAASILIAHPAAAAASAERVGAVTTDSEEIGAGTPVWVILLVFAGLLAIAEVTGLIDVLGEDDPVSP